MILNSFGAARLLDKNESELVGVTVGDSDHSYNMSSVGSVIESECGYQCARRCVGVGFYRDVFIRSIRFVAVGQS